MTQRVAILISGGGSNMVALAQSMQGDHPSRPVLVVSNDPDAGGLAKATDMGIPTAVVDHRDFSDRAAFDAALLAVLVILIFIFSVDLSLVNAIEVAPGVLWVAILFAGTLGLNRSFTLEKENSGLQGLMLAPIDRSAIYFGKMLMIGLIIQMLRQQLMDCTMSI